MMKMKRGFLSIFAALTLFLSGILTGHYYAYYQWGEIYHEERDVSEEVMVERNASSEDTKDLMERQEQLREQESGNFFSDLGKTLGGSPR
ncbi:hypothetical protein JCM19037_2542 [Geomicrobium sp. JCM 19037]|uniref:hypothetical protein n=1 Tax=unclassified Geomicrobium TaxID=2628951 RepID=UPI00045F2EBA|nr:MULTISPECIES: hypothetical protein [unclassified Geomicrobium]GAK04158.1 hypothetical protein JCM19037_2542 [Geomicrobium sp. JCM 19037]GAK11448.1 hypothetical protein JCM19039_1145 [Geomicrobium sp. JCM 19039]